MGKIGKISPIKRQYSDEQGASLAASLAAKGYTMFPNTVFGIVPYKERNGEYRTGLDPNALYIKRMAPEEAEQEIARVSALREQLEEMTGLDLGPRSDYYRNLFQPASFGENSSAAYVKLTDGPNTFNLGDSDSAITFAWLRVHPDIAPSFVAWERGMSSHRCPVISQCKFFVDDDEFESDIVYRQKTAINKAVNQLVDMSPTRQMKVAKLLGLPVSYNDKPNTIYNLLDNFIKQASGSTRTSANIGNFEKIAKMADENVEIRFRIKEAFDYNIYRVAKGGKIKEGDVTMADSEEELVEFFSSPKNQEDYLALEKKINSAKTLNI